MHALLFLRCTVLQAAAAAESVIAARRVGHWVLLNNVHLMSEWLVDLVRLLDSFSSSDIPAHPAFRLILSSEPSTEVWSCRVC